MSYSTCTRILGLLAGAAFACAAAAAMAADTQSKSGLQDLEQVYSLEASGTMLVAPDGSVAEAKVETVFDDNIRNALARSVGRLRFEPVKLDGVPVAARTGFHAVLLGRKQGGDLVVTMDSIDFRAPKGEKPDVLDNAKDSITALHMGPPEYPRGPERSGVMGQVKIVIRVATDGSVADVGVVDSKIWDTGLGSTNASRALREFEIAATRAARKWTFNVPADAAKRGAEDMTVGTSVAFVFQLRNDVQLDKEGQWLPIFKAPKREVAWLKPADSKRFADTALADGGLSGGSKFKLLTPVGGASVF